MDRYTGLILVSAPLTNLEANHIESKILETLSAFTITILDRKSMQIRDRYFLAIYINLDKAHQKAIDSDLKQVAEELQVDLAVDYRQE